MIAIFSHSNDYSVLEVCKWLDFYNQPFVLLNELSIITDIKIEIKSNFEIKAEVILNNELLVDLYKITSIYVQHN